MHPNIVGVQVDELTRCAHYHSDVDIIAIKFYCCNTYYPCHLCHDEMAGHSALKWPKDKFNETAVLCGECHYEMTINEYLTCNAVCPHCGGRFNSGCEKHHGMYFQI